MIETYKGVEKMKIKYILAVLVVFILPVMAGCSTLPKQVSLDDSSSGTQTEIATGGLVTVTLDSNATTGYSWELTGISDNNVLQKTDNTYEAPTSSLIGAGGKEVWTFTALNAGKATINMSYSQPWAGGQKGTKTYTLTVTVK
jgi:inhibitor of cysteine peptidase